MKKTTTWEDNLNNVIRDVLFVDTELLDYMLIPQNDRQNIIKFIDKYLVRSISSDELITNEDVRIVYGETKGFPIGHFMNQKYLFFDIYVKDNHLHDATNDMLKFRTGCICQRLKELLISEKYVCRIDFSYVDDFDMYTRQIGYARRRILFSYKTSF